MAGPEREGDQSPADALKDLRVRLTGAQAYLRIDELPGNLNEALDELEKDDLVRETLGDHLFEHFVAAKREEWLDYIKHVSPWEIERYLGMY